MRPNAATPARRLGGLALALALSVGLAACGADDDAAADDVAVPEGSDGPLVMEPQDAGDDLDEPGGPPVDLEGGDPLPLPPGMDPDAAPASPEAFARAEEARRQWAQLEVTSYEMVVERICFCPTSGELRVTVEDGVVTAAAFTDPARADEPLQPEWAPTLDQLLDNALSVARGFEDVALDITVEDGVPVRGSADAPMVADEEVTWTVLEFSPL